MKSATENIFHKKNGIIIGAIHFPPLLGYPDFPGMDVAFKNALLDLEALEKGGADAVIVENNYDIPHKTIVGPETVACMAILASKIKAKTKLPVGVSVLWNDYRAAFAIAKTAGLSFIRVPVFVDDVKTSYGLMKGDPKAVIAAQKELDASNIAIFADIHVKHSEILSKHTLSESAKLAQKEGAHAIIVTGKWTGDAPDLAKLSEARKAVPDFPIFCGSGIDETNISSLFKVANGAIVSTSLKEGGAHDGEVNVKPYESRLSTERVRRLVSAMKKARS
ncbi:MAG TPA: BtpA/SgcQ family protein [Candidatus Paceibacterota bacterium]|nr:BtpA/SgcQ family protein [Candidatus Paceibacterota bacterium]